MSGLPTTRKAYHDGKTLPNRPASADRSIRPALPALPVRCNASTGAWLLPVAMFRMYGRNLNHRAAIKRPLLVEQSSRDRK